MNELFLDTKLLLLGMNLLKFVYFEKATKFCEISTLLLTTVNTDKSKVEISQNCVAFSEYMNFTYPITYLCVVKKKIAFFFSELNGEIPFST